MKRTKYIPAIVTLLGCLAATIITYVNHYQALHAMIIILVVLIAFYIVGVIVKSLADKYLVIEELKLEDLEEKATEILAEELEEQPKNIEKLLE